MNISKSKQVEAATPVEDIHGSGGVQNHVAQALVSPTDEQSSETSAASSSVVVKEIGGPKGLEPTRYGDWEAKGRCYDF